MAIARNHLRNVKLYSTIRSSFKKNRSIKNRPRSQPIPWERLQVEMYHFWSVEPPPCIMLKQRKVGIYRRVTCIPQSFAKNGSFLKKTAQ